MNNMYNNSFQASAIKKYLASLNVMAESMRTYRDNLNSHWQAPEIADINRAIGEILRSITNLNNIMQSLASEIDELNQIPSLIGERGEFKGPA
ncbi:MAG: hypothetical protein GX206_07345 [Clostridiales bacterium]|nr:hypothetical protein [Clostridiales bacterium]